VLGVSLHSLSTLLYISAVPLPAAAWSRAHTPLNWPVHKEVCSCRQPIIHVTSHDLASIQVPAAVQVRQQVTSAKHQMQCRHRRRQVFCMTELAPSRPSYENAVLLLYTNYRWPISRCACSILLCCMGCTLSHLLCDLQLLMLMHAARIGRISTNGRCQHSRRVIWVDCAVAC
jgi:hypothetical protein